MKTITILLSTFICFNSYSQFYTGLEIGKSDLNYVAELKVGYELKNAGFEGSMLFHFDRVNAAYFGGSLGYNIGLGDLLFTPLIGYNYRLISTDKKVLNGWCYNTGIRVEVKHLFFEYKYMDKINF